MSDTAAHSGSDGPSPAGTVLTWSERSTNLNLSRLSIPTCHAYSPHTLRHRLSRPSLVMPTRSTCLRRPCPLTRLRHATHGIASDMPIHARAGDYPLRAGADLDRRQGEPRPARRRPKPPHRCAPDMPPLGIALLHDWSSCDNCQPLRATSQAMSSRRGRPAKPRLRSPTSLASTRQGGRLPLPTASQRW